jgi:hypothetical protein
MAHRPIIARIRPQLCRDPFLRRRPMIPACIIERRTMYVKCISPTVRMMSPLEGISSYGLILCDFSAERPPILDCFDLVNEALCQL